jgi:hypothetical protein
LIGTLIAHATVDSSKEGIRYMFISPNNPSEVHILKSILLQPALHVKIIETRDVGLEGSY